MTPWFNLNQHLKDKKAVLNIIVTAIIYGIWSHISHGHRMTSSPSEKNAT